MNESDVGYFKRFMAGACHYCPLCRFGRKNPESFVGKILHHKMHADHCPFWKREKEVYGSAKDED
ncbi:MAG: hypothetical protein MUO52_14800 [Desulfobacterales bacterium]|nr:hypothetical protein [Desulfobacterales bacterium]